ncbi:hypothetical protein HMPREF0673_02082 [Leyella stercorea DSM 18206]|uniref:Uncharacterized protein n=1 Tax=Leyella stercorea DSM 18206 TaxID=1002367 RepID=G6AZL7_9BACT|nr:hypothetical protein HMPREF0673_02082 [Leyella stercorea DSM 18206]
MLSTYLINVKRKHLLKKQLINTKRLRKGLHQDSRNGALMQPYVLF